MKRTKQDKQFMIQFDQSNRDFLINTSIFLMSFCISVVALSIATLTVIIALNGVTVYSVIVALIFGLIIIVLVIPIYLKIKKHIKDGFKINKQLQDKLFELYPEYKNKLH